MKAEWLTKAAELAQHRAELEIALGARHANQNPLSGEWAGDPTTTDLYATVSGADPDDWDDETVADADDIADAYESAYFEAYEILPDELSDKQWFQAMLLIAETKLNATDRMKLRLTVHRMNFQYNERQSA